MWENNFLKQNSQHRVMQNRGFYKSEKNSKIYQKKNTMELVKRNLCRSKHKYELKLKIKVSKTQQIQIKHLDQNQETNKPNKVLL